MLAIQVVFKKINYVSDVYCKRVTKQLLLILQLLHYSLSLLWMTIHVIKEFYTNIITLQVLVPVDHL